MRLAPLVPKPTPSGSAKSKNTLYYLLDELKRRHRLDGFEIAKRNAEHYMMLIMFLSGDIRDMHAFFVHQIEEEVSKADKDPGPASRGMVHRPQQHALGDRRFLPRGPLDEGFSRRRGHRTRHWSRRLRRLAGSPRNGLFEASLARDLTRSPASVQCR
ncbi:MAG TPA: hypothetical protein VK034_10415 [Enhygromyxa sp.]|nr:hypothetical protein [Enhygromyxa sp.]